MSEVCPPYIEVYLCTQVQMNACDMIDEERSAAWLATTRKAVKMSGDTPVTLIGNLTGDPELRYTPSGVAVSVFTVASTPRFFDKASGEWKDGDTLFMRCSLWRQAAENMAESLTRGARVIVSGRLQQRSYEDKDGEKRTVYEVQADECGPSLRSASMTIKKAQRVRAADPGSEDIPPTGPAAEAVLDVPPF